jgi:hypothetical protein
MNTTEQALESWFARQAARERATPRLEDALLGGRFAAYFVHRLRFFGARYAVGTAVQLVKVLFLHRLLGTGGFFAVIGLVAVAGLVGGGWWGALELLRSRVRVLYRFESPRAVGREVARWIVGAARVSLALGAAAAAYLGLRAAAGGGVSPVDLAIAAVLFRSAVDLPIRAYHAGAFALRRVYRPWVSILALEVLGLGLLLVLAPLAGAWAVGLSEIAMAVAFAGIGLRYTARTHRLLGLAPHRLVSVRAILRPGQKGRRQGGHARARAWMRDAGGFSLAAAAGVAMSLDSLVILAAASVATVSDETWLAVLMAGIAPTVRAGFDWSQLVYFDLMRLNAPLFENLRRRLDRATLVLAVLFGGAFSVVAVGIAVGPLGIRATAIAALPPFLLAASLLGLSQMEAFTTGAYRPVIAGGVVLVAGLALLQPLAATGMEPLAVLACAAAAAVAVVRLGSRSVSGGHGTSDVLLPTAWLARLRAETHPVRVGAARLRAAAPGRVNGSLADPVMYREWRAMQLGRRLAGRAGRQGAVSVIDADHVAWFVRDAVRPAVTRRTVVMAAGGRVADVYEARAATGDAAIAALAGWPVFASPPTRQGRRTAAVPADQWDAERRFRALLPGGLVFRPDQPPPDALLAVDVADRRLFLWDAIRHARRMSSRPGRGAWDVTTWCPDGTLRLIFLAPRAAGERALVRWRRLIRAANLAAASGGRLPAQRTSTTRLTARAIVEGSARGSAPPVLAASAATEFRPG